MAAASGSAGVAIMEMIASESSLAGAEKLTAVDEEDRGKQVRHDRGKDETGQRQMRAGPATPSGSVPSRSRR